MVDPDPVVSRGHIAADKESGILLWIDSLLRKPNSSTSILGFGCPDAHCFTFGPSPYSRRRSMNYQFTQVLRNVTPHQSQWALSAEQHTFLVVFDWME